MPNWTHRALPMLAVLSEIACGNAERPPAYQRRTLPTNEDAGISIPIDSADASVTPPEDTTGLCGNQILRPVLARPNLYLVLDRSGSMTNPMKDPSTQLSIEKWKAARQAVHEVLFTLGHRLAYGAAVFPAFGVIDSCAPGAEIDPISDGDAVTYARNGVTGPHLTRLQAALDRFVPEGSTPTSSTLNSLADRLIAFPGNTTVILATDGAPNCNEHAVCDVNHCTPNLEHAPLPGGGSCDANVNCCEVGYYGPPFCIDVDATLVPLARLLAHGIKTYVIGLPGSEVFADALERMALAGGTARTDPVGTDTNLASGANAAGGAGQLGAGVSFADAASFGLGGAITPSALTGNGGAITASALTGNGGAITASALTGNGGAITASALTASGGAITASAPTASGGAITASAPTASGGAITAIAPTASGGATIVGSERASGPGYYPVTDAAQLTAALRKITATLSISCTVQLDAAPPDWSLVNVYFDNAIVKMDPSDGWKQIDARTLEITGALCELLRSGDVFQLQIVAGCPTEVLR